MTASIPMFLPAGNKKSDLRVENDESEKQFGDNIENVDGRRNKGEDE